jgi:hypothetical protein
LGVLRGQLVSDETTPRRDFHTNLLFLPGLHSSVF